MQGEWLRMLYSALPWHWTYAKGIYVLALIFAILGWKFRKRLILHILLMNTACLVALGLFLEGVAKRGVTGSVGKTPHGTIWLVVVIFHVVAGGLFILGALYQNITGAISMKSRARFDSQAYHMHKRSGPFWIWCLAISVVLALFVS